MIPIVQTDDTTLIREKSICGLRYANRDFRDSSIIETPPEGYMTSDEFRQRAILKVNKFCKENGIL